MELLFYKYFTPSGLGALALGFGSNLLKLPITSDYFLTLPHIPHIHHIHHIPHIHHIHHIHLLPIFHPFGVGLGFWRLRFGSNLLRLPITSDYFLISLLFITFIIS